MKQIIRVFEYEYLKVDESRFTRKHWEALSHFNAKHDSKYFVLYASAIKFKQYVGVIQAGNLTIEILPKVDRFDFDNADRSKWHGALVKMLRECKLIKTEYPELAHLKLQSNTILEIYLKIFLAEIQMLLHSGLIKKYRKIEGNQTALKGRLLFQKQISKNLVNKERFYVQYNLYDKNHLLHKVLLKALRLVSHISNNPNIVGKAQQLLLDFPELEDVAISEKTFEQIVINRKTERYSQALIISKMILLNYRPDITGGGENILALMFDMNKLWEEYVYRQLIKKESGVVQVTMQNSVDFWQADKYYSPVRLRPDMIVNIGNTEQVVIDTKWKLIEDNNPSSDDLQQMFAYSHYVGSKNMILLYPSLDKKKKSGKYLLKHVVNGIEENITCSVLRVPLLWETNGSLLGLDIDLNDIVGF